MDPSTCSAGRTLEVVGQPWAMLVMREVLHGLHRFDQIQRHIAVSPAVLSRRLDLLVSAGLLTRVPYRERGSRERHEYRLTEAGRDLFPVLLALRNWGDRHLGGPGPAVTYRHRDCGAELRLALVCADGHPVAGREDAVAEPGPGARELDESQPTGARYSSAAKSRA